MKRILKIVINPANPAMQIPTKVVIETTNLKDFQRIGETLKAEFLEWLGGDELELVGSNQKGEKLVITRSLDDLKMMGAN
ncbi:MAG: hypothetical protein AAF329_00470 [Cyanobacteria bacterium P01_A01_bin.17]